MTNHLTMNTVTMADAAALYQISAQDIISDRISIMLQQESSPDYRPVDYLATAIMMNELQSSPYVAKLVEEEHRAARSKMCSWCYQVTDTCTLSRHAVMRAMNILDRYLATASQHDNSRARKCFVDRREYQLAAMTALYISIKVHEPLRVDASLLAEISAGCYTTTEILDMERHMLQSLQWKLHAPTSKEYVALFLGLLDPQGYGYDLSVPCQLLELATLQCELACGDYELSARCKPSEVALGSLLNALEAICNNDDEEVDESHDDAGLTVEAKYEYVAMLCEVLTRHNHGFSVSLDTRLLKYVWARLWQLFHENSGIVHYSSLPDGKDRNEDLPTMSASSDDDDGSVGSHDDSFCDGYITSGERTRTTRRKSNMSVVSPWLSSCQVKCVSPLSVTQCR